MTSCAFGRYMICMILDENAIEETFKMMALLRKLMTSSGSIKKK